MWSGLLEPQAVVQFQYAGYYTQLIRPGLRVVALNTMFCDSSDYWLVLPGTEDLGGQIEASSALACVRTVERVTRARRSSGSVTSCSRRGTPARAST
jgi:hypothetical protein